MASLTELTDAIKTNDLSFFDNHSASDIEQFIFETMCLHDAITGVNEPQSHVMNNLIVMSPIQFAVVCGSLEFLKLWLEKRAQISGNLNLSNNAILTVKGHQFMSLLACRSGKTEMVEYIDNLYKSIHFEKYYQRFFHWALDNFYSFVCPFSQNDSMLFFALTNHEFEAADECIKKGCNINVSIKTARGKFSFLQEMIRNNNLKAVKFLINNGANVNQLCYGLGDNPKPRLAISFAIEKNFLEITKFLTRAYVNQGKLDQLKYLAKKHPIIKGIIDAYEDAPIIKALCADKLPPEIVYHILEQGYHELAPTLDEFAVMEPKIDRTLNFSNALSDVNADVVTPSSSKKHRHEDSDSDEQSNAKKARQA